MPAQRITVEIGERFGKWTVIGEGKPYVKGKSKRCPVIVRCECGAESSVLPKDLIKGKSVGCRRCALKSVPTPGEKFGKWTVIAEAAPRFSQKGSRYTMATVRCECGNEAIVQYSAMKSKGGSRGCQECYRKARDERLRSYKGENHPSWKGGKSIHPSGYIYVKAPEGNPRGTHHGYILEHLLVMEQILGRPVREDETVHHKNGIRTDNRPENLELWSKQHAPGSRVDDLVRFAIEILTLYAPERLA